MLRSNEVIGVDSKSRFTVYSSSCIRLQWDASGIFEDRPTQVFYCLPKSNSFSEFEVNHIEKGLQISTKDFVFLANGPGPESWEVTYHTDEGDQKLSLFEADKDNLGGTMRTLDGAYKTKTRFNLPPGLISKRGYTVVDDSNGLVFDEGGFLRKHNKTDHYGDIYLFVYGHNYFKCLSDFTKLSGNVPLLPKYALGLWWSKYWAYTDQELLNLINKFKQMDIPLSVLGVDMDWHIVEGCTTSHGWTGYTWNTKYFPDPGHFLQSCHQNNIKVYLNLHPADGCHPHENMYTEFSKFLGFDPESKAPIDFDLTNPLYIKGYFDYLHNPHEQIGVDFWWIDWQQGDKTKNFPELDPLWYLNHLHWSDKLRTNNTKRPLILSRWGGLGGHRYPVGFSGDTTAEWDVLNVLPEITSNAANVLFLWSHDVGGFMWSINDGELYLRWAQFSAFSHIFRFHSTSNQFEYRLPWDYEPNWCYGAIDAIQKRQLLLPYIYTACYRMHTESRPWITPIYYHHPKDETAYKIPQQYYFGDSLIVSPFLTPRSQTTLLSRKPTYLPEGNWFDLYSGRQYAGNRWFSKYGGIMDIPVFAKGGSIIPMLLNREELIEKEELFGYKDLHLVIFPCGSSCYTLYEDDGSSLLYQKDQYCLTTYKTEWLPQENSLLQGGKMHFTISPKVGAIDNCHSKCIYKLEFKAIYNGPSDIQIKLNDVLLEDSTSSYSASQAILTLYLNLSPTDKLTVEFTTSATTKTVEEFLFEDFKTILKSQQLPSQWKSLCLKDIQRLSQNRYEIFKYVPKNDKDQMRAWVEVFGDLGYQYVHTLNKDRTFISWNYGKIPDFSISAQYNSRSQEWEDNEQDKEVDIEKDVDVLKEIVVTSQQMTTGRHHVRVTYGKLFSDDYSFGVVSKEPEEDTCNVS